jgi:hypothetical protein
MQQTLNFAFWFHLFITLLGWVAPFLVSWYVILPIYAILILQFIFLKKCILNKAHDVGEEDNITFYAVVFELMGFKPNRAQLKFYVRKVFYPALSAFTLFWQLGLGIKPLWF